MSVRKLLQGYRYDNFLFFFCPYLFIVLALSPSCLFLSVPHIALVISTKFTTNDLDFLFSFPLDDHRRQGE